VSEFGGKLVGELLWIQTLKVAVLFLIKERCKETIQEGEKT
jgi:hypothetical protein